jgi:hypothetical protein
MYGGFPRRFIIVVPPNAAAGIGDALRKAFRPDQGKNVFEQLIARLDQPG